MKVYNAATATIENNEIANVEIDDVNAEVNSTFTNNTLSEEAETVLKDAGVIEEAEAVATVNGEEYASLQAALDAAAADSGEVTVEILADIDLTDVDWNPVTVSAPKYPVVTVNGNNKTITGLNDMLFAGTWAGGSGLIINDLTIKDSNIVNDEDDSKGNVGVGAFIGFPQASATVTLNNCHLVDSTVSGGHWTGGLIGYAAGYAGNDGPVFMNLTITDCSVSGSTVTGKGSAGGIIGHGSGNGWTNVVIENTTVSNNTITSTGTSANKAGAVMGTIGAAGQPTTVNGVTKTGGASIDATVSGNNVTSAGTTITTIYGRQGTTTGMLYVTGGTYEYYPIEEGVSYAAPADGFVIEQNENGTYDVFVEKKNYAAEADGVKYETIAEAIENAENEVIIYADDYTGGLTVNKAITVKGETDANGKNLVNISGKLSITADGAIVKNVNINNASDTAGYISAKDVVIEGCSVVGGNGFRWCYTDGLTTFKDCTITGSTYGIHFDGECNGEVKIDNCVITGWTSFASTITKVTISDSEFAEGNYNQLRFYQDSEITDTEFNPDMNVDFGKDAVVCDIKNCTVTDGSPITDVIYLGDIAEMGVKVTVDDAPVQVAASVTSGEDTAYYLTLQAAVDAAKTGETIVIINDFELDTIVTVTNGKKITLDLNGKTITGTDTTSKNFSLIDNRGDLTITGNGKMTLTATIDSGTSRYSAVLANNPGGKLTIENGTFEHLGGTYMAYGIDNLTNGKGTYAETIINGGLIKSTYRGIRQFLNGIEAQNILTINGGTIEGVNKSIFFHDPSAKANTGTLTVGENAVVKGDIYLFVTEGSTEWPVEVSIAASALVGSEVTSKNVPSGYEVVKKDGAYGVALVPEVEPAITRFYLQRYENGTAAIYVDLSNVDPSDGIKAEVYSDISKSDQFNGDVKDYAARVGITVNQRICTTEFNQEKRGDLKAGTLDTLSVYIPIGSTDSYWNTVWDDDGKYLTEAYMPTNVVVTIGDKTYTLDEFTVLDIPYYSEYGPVTHKHWDAVEGVADVALPTATVTELENKDLTFALSFTADDPSNDQLRKYWDWYADFELVVSGDVTFNANGNADGYLSGQYESHSESWLDVPFGDVEVTADKAFRIMDYADSIFPNNGLKFRYYQVYAIVQTFNCGVFFEEDFMAANPDFEVGLALKMYDNGDKDGDVEGYAVGPVYEFEFATPVAKIGETSYTTLQAAIDAAKPGDVITLLEDVTLDEMLTVDADDNIVLDLNGKKIDAGLDTTRTDGGHLYAFTNYGTLTVKDSVGTGEINARGNFNYGVMTLENGTINAIDGNGGYGVKNYENASFTLDGGKIATTYEDDNKVSEGGYDATPVSVDNGASFVMNNGEIVNVCDFTMGIENRGTTTIKGGTVTSIHTTIANYNNMEISGGIFVNNGIEGITAHALWAAAGTTTITGGTFNGKDNYNGFNVDASEGAVVNISGGNFLNVHSGSLYGNGTISVSGGTFFDKISENRVAEGYKVIENTNGTYGVVAAPEEDGIMDNLLAIWDMPIKTDVNGTKYYPIHIYSGIDSLKYQKVGFKVTVTNTDTGDTKDVTYDTTVVYRSMKVTKSNGTVELYKASKLGDACAYMFGQELPFGVGNGWTDENTEIKITPYAIDLNGKEIIGTTKLITNEIVQACDPDTSLFKEEE